MTEIWAQAVKTETATFDMTRDDYAFDPRDGGQRGHVSCWNGKAPKEGDYLILRNGGGSSRYRVTAVDPCRGVDPPTMWMADLEFAPRPRIPAASSSGTGPGVTDRK